MQGTGNDFIAIDNRSYNIPLEELIALTPKLCHRKYGIGADGLLVLQNPRLPNTDYEMVYRNADGSDAGMCGNGSRCLALLASRLGLPNELTFNVHDKIYTASVEDPDSISVTFPMTTEVKEIDMPENTTTYYQVYTGTEHIAREADKDELENLEALKKEGSQLRHHTRFQPAGTNVNFFCGINDHKLKLQTYERGVEDLTLACGTGAIASALAWHHIQEADHNNTEIHVETPGGELVVTFRFEASNESYQSISLTGPAKVVFEGVYDL